MKTVKMMEVELNPDKPEISLEDFAMHYSELINGILIKQEHKNENLIHFVVFSSGEDQFGLERKFTIFRQRNKIIVSEII